MAKRQAKGRSCDPLNLAFSWKRASEILRVVVPAYVIQAHHQVTQVPRPVKFQKRVHVTCWVHVIVHVHDSCETYIIIEACQLIQTIHLLLYFMIDSRKV